MQTKQIITICDLDTTQTEATKTLHFSVGKRKYVLDLCEAHYEEVNQAFKEVIDQFQGRTKTTSSAVHNAADIRVWAREAGYEISSAGPIPKALREAYAAA